MFNSWKLLRDTVSLLHLKSYYVLLVVSERFVWNVEVPFILTFVMVTKKEIVIIIIINKVPHVMTNFFLIIKITLNKPTRRNVTISPSQRSTLIWLVSGMTYRQGIMSSSLSDATAIHNWLCSLGEMDGFCFSPNRRAMLSLCVQNNAVSSPQLFPAAC